MSTPRPLLITELEDKNSFQVLILIMCILSGVGGLITKPQSATLTESFPGWIVYVWYSGLIISAGISLVGLYMRTIVRYEVERTGLILLGGLTFAFYVGIWFATKMGGLSVGAMFILGCCLACAHRIYRIGKITRRVREVIDP